MGLRNAGFVAAAPWYEWINLESDGWQFGEQGIVDALAGEDTGHCIEVGAGNGRELPTTVDRLIRRGWSAVLYEADSVAREKLDCRYGREFRGVAVNGEALPAFLKDVVAPGTVVVIDVDGDDVHFFVQALALSPKLIVCEHLDRCCPVQPHDPTDIPPDWLLGKHLAIDGRCYVIQAGAEQLRYLAEPHGYQLLGMTRVNSFYAHPEYAKQLRRDSGT